MADSWIRRVDGNLVDRLAAGVAGETLHIGLEPDASYRNVTLEADVEASDLSRIDANGASTVFLPSELVSDWLELELSAPGASKLDLLVHGKGSTTAHTLLGRRSADDRAVSGAGSPDIAARPTMAAVESERLIPERPAREQASVTAAATSRLVVVPRVETGQRPRRCRIKPSG